MLEARAPTWRLAQTPPPRRCIVVKRSVALTLVLALGCGESPETHASTPGSLPAGVVARVGHEAVSMATVARVMAAQNLTPRAALDRVLSDALLAEGARARVPAATTKAIENAALARGLLEGIGRSAEQLGAATSAELDEITRERWAELARPVSVRTTHAVVLTDKPGTEPAARALAEKIAAVVSGATSGEELIRLALAVPAEGLRVVAEALPLVTADGRVLTEVDGGFRAGSSKFDPDFAKAANAIAEPGQLSPLVKSAFGYHVIRLEQRVPATGFTEAELRERLQADVVTRRARRAKRELLEQLRRENPVQVERAVDDLTRRIDLQP
jgi:PPIC-type PPIASE domain